MKREIQLNYNTWFNLSKHGGEWKCDIKRRNPSSQGSYHSVRRLNYSISTISIWTLNLNSNSAVSEPIKLRLYGLMETWWDEAGSGENDE